MGAPLGNTTADRLSHSNCGSASPKSVTSAVGLPSTYRTETDLACPAPDLSARIVIVLDTPAKGQSLLNFILHVRAQALQNRYMHI
jgi:hypothetical protein